MTTRLSAAERDENVCEHGDHPAPPGKRFCSDACKKCEIAECGPSEECADLCGWGKTYRALDAEQARWQDRIEQVIIERGFEPFDASGGDSGDPLDFTAKQVEWALGDLCRKRDRQLLAWLCDNRIISIEQYDKAIALIDRLIDGDHVPGPVAPDAREVPRGG